MKKIFIITTLIITTLVAFISCAKDFDKINTNPNKPVNVLSYGLFNKANKQLIDGTRGAFSSGRMFLPWVQYSAQRNYTEEDRFQFRPSTNQNIYDSLYRANNNYKTIIDLNEDPETSVEMAKYGDLKNQIAAARIMLVYSFSILVDMYGDVPYYSYGNKDPDFQALQLEEGILKPKFASQLKIYTDLLKELKEASEMIDVSKTVFTRGDHLFRSADKLKKFANSLRLRIGTRVKGVVPGADIHITEAIAAGVMSSNNDTVGLQYEKNDINPSPLYKTTFIDARNDFAVANTFIDVLKGDRGDFDLDPRLQKYVAPNYTTLDSIKNQNYKESNDLTKYLGMAYGATNAIAVSQQPVSSLFSYNVLKQDYTEILIEYAEVEFLLSENNGWNDTNYKKGVEASMERWGVDPAKIAAFVGTLPPVSQANVLNQKYIALYMQPFEAWSEYRRTGFPDTLLKPEESHTLNAPDPDGNLTYTFTPLIPLTDVPTRVTYPVNLQTLNKENYDAASQNIGGDQLDTKLIWDKN